jgi:hypothetical protein
MSWYGLLVALQFSQELPAFPDQVAAEEALFACREQGLIELCSLSGVSASLDYSPESLKLIEAWFFENGQPIETISGYPVAHVIGFYFGEVLCRSQQFHWVVEESPFAEGRYEIGVKRDLLAIMLTKGMRPRLAGNKRMQSLWRASKRYAR